MIDIIDKATQLANKLNKNIAIVELARVISGCGYAELNRANLVNMAIECIDCQNYKYLLICNSTVSDILLTGANGKIVHRITYSSPR